MGTYKAWLSTSTVNASTRLGSARGFIRPDGSPFADKVSDITAGKILNPLNRDENGGGNVGHEGVWTATTSAGTVSANTCDDWMSNTMAFSGDAGNTYGGPGAWSFGGGAGSCNGAISLYCFDTSHVSTLTVTPTPGRVAFVSKGSFDTSKGVPVADALCQSEATAAGLKNPMQFLALLSTSTVAAASRFDFSALSPPYVRPDGIKIADAPTVAAGEPLDSGIWQHADGSYLTSDIPLTWTGSTSPSLKDSLANTCQDWSTANPMDNGASAASNIIAPWWNSGNVSSCGDPWSVYCLEE